MAPEVTEVLETAKLLGRDQIADLAYELLRVLDDGDVPADPGKAEAAWRAEFHRRIDGVESGAVELVDGPETLALARAMLAARIVLGR
jgi:hypothetical protein